LRGSGAEPIASWDLSLQAEALKQESGRRAASRPDFRNRVYAAAGVDVREMPGMDEDREPRPQAIRVLHSQLILAGPLIGEWFTR
jgi:hypothetical protein